MQPELSKIFAAFSAQPWCMERARMEAQLVALSGLAGDLKADAIQDAMDKANAPMEPSYLERDGVAIMTVRGMIMKNIPWIFEYFGIEATSTEQLRFDLADALQNPAVKGVLFQVESPGGMVYGTQQLGDDIFAARNVKPMAASIEDLCASGAYWISSQTGAVFANETAEVGSIGVVGYFDDFSRMYENIGVTQRVIASARLKAAGDEYGSRVSPDQVEWYKAIVQGLAEKFIAAVSRGRGMPDAKVRASATGEVWLAEEAQKRGLIDDIATTEEVFASMADRLN